MLLIRFRQRDEPGINVAGGHVEFDAVRIPGFGEQPLGLVDLLRTIEQRAILIARPHRVITRHDAAAGAQNKVDQGLTIGCYSHRLADAGVGERLSVGSKDDAHPIACENAQHLELRVVLEEQ